MTDLRVCSIASSVAPSPVYIYIVYTNGNGTCEKGADIEAALDLIQQSYALQRELVGSI